MKLFFGITSSIMFFVLVVISNHPTDYGDKSVSAQTSAPVNAALKAAKMEWLEARAAQTSAAVKYGADRNSISEYKAIQARATVAMNNLELERARVGQ